MPEPSQWNAANFQCLFNLQLSESFSGSSDDRDSLGEAHAISRFAQRAAAYPPSTFQFASAAPKSPSTSNGGSFAASPRSRDVKKLKR